VEIGKGVGETVVADAGNDINQNKEVNKAKKYLVKFIVT
jgi:hypothetical protein